MYLRDESGFRNRKTSFALCNIFDLSRFALQAANLENIGISFQLANSEFDILVIAFSFDLLQRIIAIFDRLSQLIRYI